MRLALALLGVGCGFEREVLSNPAGVVASCEDAWRSGTSGAPCAFEGTCARATPLDPDCCTDFAYCAGALVVDTSCAPGCGCEVDADCVPGLSICAAPECVACPSEALCEPCPEGWERLERNGCPTCRCAPPSQCEPEVAPCVEGECYPGSSCAEGCDPDQDACCANVCAAPGCEGPAPVGCLTACTDATGGLCATSTCACEDGAWTCASVPVGRIDAPCVFP